MEDKISEELPEHVLEGIIGFVRYNISDEVAVPGRAAKKIFLRRALPRDDFFPEDLQREIDARKGDMPQENYLFSHFSFESIFGAYR